jgi:tRNA dimethylallyltransferase
MDPQRFASALILSGPTASGKSAVGLHLAQRLGAEIISMDSMAVYRGLDIGTAKPTPAERNAVPHHLIDVLDPWDSATVAWWVEQAASACDAIQARGRRVLIVGGTPLYLKALLRGLFQGPAADPELREKLEARGGPSLHAELTQRDAPTAARLHVNDIRRLVRALEVLALTGQPISDWQQQFEQVRAWANPPLWLDLPRSELYERIDRRVHTMLAAGLLDEVRRLTADPRGLSKEASQALGYKELLDHLAGRMPLGEATLLIQTRSRQFAKRQLTWFRHLEECVRLEVDPNDSAEAIAQRVLARWGLTSG